MSNTPKLFFATGASFVLIGMAWGIEMSVRQDFMLAPAHAHLNLIGFVIMSVYGAYYALTPAAAGSGLARAHYALHVVTVVLMVPGIVMALKSGSEGLVKIGSVLAILSMALFLFMILKHGVGRQE